MTEPKKNYQLLSADPPAADLDTLTKQLEAVIDEENWHQASSLNEDQAEKKSEILELEKELAALKKENELLPLLQKAEKKELITENLAPHKKSSWPLYQSFKLHPGEWQAAEQQKKFFLQEQWQKIKNNWAYKKEQDQYLKAQILAKEKKLKEEKEKLLIEQRAKKAAKRAQEELTKNQLQIKKKQAEKTFRQAQAAEKQRKKLARAMQIQEWQKKIAAEKEKKQAAKILQQAQKKQAREKYYQEKNDQLKNKFSKPKGWYWLIVRRPVIYLAGVEFLLYFFSLIPSWRVLFLDILLPYVLVLDLVVFVWLSLRLRILSGETRWATIKCLLLAGCLIGLARSIFKVVWFSELWTIFNILSETLITSLMAGFIALIISLVAREHWGKEQPVEIYKKEDDSKNEITKYELADL